MPTSTHRFWAIFHDGHYHMDKIVFEPLVDQVPYETGDTMESLLIKYDDPKKEQVKGAFICPQTALHMLCGIVPASQSFGVRAASQNAHRLRSICSASWKHLGTRPEDMVDPLYPRDREAPKPVVFTDQRPMPQCAATVSARVEKVLAERKRQQILKDGDE